MLIAVIADTHDNNMRLEKALKEIRSRDIKLLFHCGDIGTKTVEPLIAENIQIYAVCGNNDDYVEMERLCRNSNIGLFEDIGEIEIDGKKIAITHMPKVAKYLAKVKKYNIIFCGHTHVRKIEKEEDTIIANPGDILARHGSPSFLIYNTISGEIEFINI